LRVPADENILSRRQVVHQIEFLVDDGNAKALRRFRVGYGDRLPVDEHLAGILLVNARQYLHKG